MTNITGGNPTVGGLGGNPSPAIAESPISGVGQNLVSSHQLRINDLSTIIAGNISDTMNFAVDLPTETYKITGLQFKDYVIAGLPVGVESVFGRINDVIAVAGDYDAVQVDFNNGLTPNWSSTDVQDALNKAYSDIQFLAGAVVLKGAWDALAGVPDLPTIPKVNGNYWIVSVEGSSVLPLFPTAPPHSLPWEVSDQALYLDDGEGNTGFVQLRTAVGDFLPITGGTMLGDIIGSNALSYNAMTSLANTATQPLDNVSSLTNDAAYITIGDVPASSVISVNGQTGVVVLDNVDVGAAFTTGSASTTFDVGTPTTPSHATTKAYVDALDVGVVSVHGRTGVVVSAAGDYTGLEVTFDPAGNPITPATNTQDAIDDNSNAISFLAGAIRLKGGWDAALNVPDLINISKISGDYWIIGVEGSTVLPLFPTAPAHVLPWEVNDRALYVDDGGGNTGFLQLRPVEPDFLALTGGTMLGDIIGSNALSYNAMTSLANTATQPLDNVSSLTNDAGYITIGDVPAVPVDSVNGQTGVVVLDAADVGAALVGGDALVAFNVGVPVGIEDATRKDYVDAAIAGRATSAQGVLADSATQPADPVSSLTNDAGYITAAPVTSVNAKTGVVVLNNVDVGAALVGGDAAQVFSVGTPTADEHATTKAYVDGAAGGIVKAFGAVVGADGNFQVSFGTAFPSVAYTISLSIGNQTIPHSFSLSWSGKLATGFLIESDLPQFSSVDWIAIENNN